MRFAKKTMCFLLAMFVIAGLLGSVQADAKEISIATPKVTVKTINKSTGVKITVGKTKDADAYEVIITGKAVVNKDYRNNNVVINGEWQDAENINI